MASTRFLIFACFHIYWASAAERTFPPAFELELEDRIVGGADADPGEFPFFVQWSGCGASLVWKDIVLSAAHVS